MSIDGFEASRLTELNSRQKYFLITQKLDDGIGNSNFVSI